MPPVAAALLRATALRLKVAGRTYPEICEELEISLETAHRWVREELAASRDADAEATEQMRGVQAARLEKLVARWLPIALAVELDISTDIERTGANGGTFVKHVEIPDYEAGKAAAEIIFKASARLAALYGLDGPTRVEHSGAVGLRPETRDELEESLGLL